MILDFAPTFALAYFPSELFKKCVLISKASEERNYRKYNNSDGCNGNKDLVKHCCKAE